MPAPVPARAPLPRREILLPAEHPPTLSIVIDTEEEFDWSTFRRDQRSVEAMAEVGRAQEIFDEFGIVPTYVVDSPVVEQETGSRDLARYAAEGRAVIGAHLHPWVAEPYEEEVNARNSYPGNLPPELEREKLRRLRDQITQVFGSAPEVYKAGRYGFGPNTPSVLAELGFTIDLSACPSFHFGQDGGPDYLHWSALPYWFGEDESLLGLPTTGAFVGWLRGAPAVHELARAEALRWSRLPGILSRLGAIERIRLSPEGYTVDEMLRLTRALLAQGVRCLTYSFHSPSLAVGKTSYVQSESDRRVFLDGMRRYFDTFLTELGGVSRTPLELRDAFRSHGHPTRRARP